MYFSIVLSAVTGAIGTVKVASALVLPPADFDPIPNATAREKYNNIVASRSTTHEYDDEPLLRYYIGRSHADEFPPTKNNTKPTTLQPRGSACGQNVRKAAGNGATAGLEPRRESCDGGGDDKAPVDELPPCSCDDDGDDKVPIDELPPCYYKCMVDNCCNMMLGGPGDVRQMTTYEFCHSKWFYVGNWLYDTVQDCIIDECAPCRPACRDESNDWMTRVCGWHLAVKGE